MKPINQGGTSMGGEGVSKKKNWLTFEIWSRDIGRKILLSILFLIFIGAIAMLIIWFNGYKSSENSLAENEEENNIKLK